MVDHFGLGMFWPVNPHDSTLRAVVALHAPRWVGQWCCEGCDPGSHAESEPDWPCTTVRLIGHQAGVDLREADR